VVRPLFDQRIFLENFVRVFWAEEEVLDIGYKTEILRRKVVFGSTDITRLECAATRCENILKVGSHHFDQCDPELS
jgi:hypothetical protein